MRKIIRFYKRSERWSVDISIWKIIQLILNTFNLNILFLNEIKTYFNNVLAMHENLRLSKKGPLRFFTAGLQEVPPPFLYFLKKTHFITRIHSLSSNDYISLFWWEKNRQDWSVKMEFTVRYTRQITALFTDISIKIHRFVCIKQA